MAHLLRWKPSKRRIVTPAVGFAVVATGLLAFASSNAQPSEVFEVASIRPSGPSPDGHSGISFLHGDFAAEGVTIKSLIEAAYNVHPFQVECRWNLINSERYDVKAKGEHLMEIDPKMRSDAELQAFLDQKKRTEVRLQALLANRFKLQLHRAFKTMHFYALIVAKGGPKFPLAKNAEDLLRSGVSVGNGKLKATNIPMSFLAETLSKRVESIVLDKTGLTGRYDLQMSWSPEDLNPGGGLPVGPSLFTALQEQLGLKLVSQKGPVEILVVDHVEKPSPN